MELLPSTSNIEQRPQLQGWQIGGALIVLALLYSLGFVIGGELGQIMLAGLQTVPFALLALLAYLGSYYAWAKVVTLLWLGGLIAGMGLVSFGLAAQALTVGPIQPGVFPEFVPGAALRIIAMVLGSGLAVCIAALGFIPAARRSLSRVLPLDPDSFVHMIALVSVVALTLLSFIPLVVLGEPLLLTIINQTNASGADLTGARDDAGLLRDTLYALIWLVPGTIIAVGYGVRRNLGEALQRLGLVRPSWRQLAVSLVLAVLLVLAVQLLSLGIEWLWPAMGWPRTDNEAFSELLAFAMSPIGAVVIGVTAGLGEELAVRGVLQPKLGILLSNLFFTALHAFQYNWDSLLIVFLLGTILGLIRQRTNTTTAAIVHGTYNFLLIMLAVLNIPGLSQ